MADRGSFRLLPLLLTALLVGCSDVESPVTGGGGGADGEAPRFQYVREYVFVGVRADTPLVVPFSFRASPAGASLEREVRAWLGRGPAWEQFLDESFTTAPSSGVWRVLPHGPLRLAAGGAAEVEALWYRRGARRLRLDLGAPLADWTRGDDVRYRLDQARLTLGEETMAGVALEVLRIERADARGTASDALVLTSGDSVRLLLAEATDADGAGLGVAWLRTPGEERSWENAEIKWLEVAPNEQARRDVPVRWTFRVPQASLQGEVVALGSTSVVGAERAGRRSIEVRYTVQGWMEREGRRTTLGGVLRHHQR